MTDRPTTATITYMVLKVGSRNLHLCTVDQFLQFFTIRLDVLLVGALA